MREYFSQDVIQAIYFVIDRDPARWHMDEKTAECRRRLFWELYTADLFHVRNIIQPCPLLMIYQSLGLGRPPSIELSYVDCAFPKAGEDSDTICA